MSTESACPSFHMSAGFGNTPATRRALSRSVQLSSSSSRRRRRRGGSSSSSSSSRESPPGATPRPHIFGHLCGRKCWYLQHFSSVVFASGNCSWYRVHILYIFGIFSSISHPKMLVFTAPVLLNFLIFCCFLKSRFSCPKPSDQNQGFCLPNFDHHVHPNPSKEEHPCPKPNDVHGLVHWRKESIHVQNLMTSMV